jgi:SAM-dependent methyltransferase
MLEWIRRNRARVEQITVNPALRRQLSPVFYVQDVGVQSAMARYAHGAVIDLGCGMMPYRSYLPPAVTAYYGMDRWPRTDAVSLAGDIQHLDMLAPASFDTVLCFEVLEHVPDPAEALRGIAQILKPGGVALISVPHLSRLHDLPHDYYRYTAYGLHYLLTQAGLEVTELRSKGGLFAFLGHQLSTVLLALLAALPFLHAPIWLANRWLVVKPSNWLDALSHSERLFPLGYVVVAIRPEDGK